MTVNKLLEQTLHIQNTSLTLGCEPECVRLSSWIIAALSFVQVNNLPQNNVR